MAFSQAQQIDQVENDPKPPFDLGAVNSHFEPKPPHAANCLNGCNAAGKVAIHQAGGHWSVREMIMRADQLEWQWHMI